MVRASGSLWDTSLPLYIPLRARPNSNNLTFTFPSGSKIQYSHLSLASDKLAWLSSNISRIIFEELTDFTEEDFFFMLSRLRSANPDIETKVKATCNPSPKSWLRYTFMDYYLNERGYPDPEKCKQTRYFVREAEQMYWSDDPDSLRDKFEREPISFKFIPASIVDNQALVTADPGYMNFLKSLHPVEKERYLYGNWLADFSQGRFIKAAWFLEADSFERYHRMVRFYDLAATAENLRKDSFFTAGVKMAHRYNPYTAQDEYCVVDAKWIKGDYAEVNDFIMDNAREDSISTTILLEQEPGASGKRDAENLKEMLSDYVVDCIPPQGSKLDRAKPFARYLSQGKIYILPFLGSQDYMQYMEKFAGEKLPLVTDLCDATSGAFNYLLA